MRRLVSLAAMSSLLLTPAAALAAFDQPGALLHAMQSEHSARTFSSEVHGHMADTWFALWMNGSGEGWNSPETADVTAKMTLDVNHKGLKVRARLELLMTGGKAFLKIASVEGVYADAIASMSGLFSQKKWVEIPLDPMLLGEWRNAVSLAPEHTELIGGALTMTSAPRGTDVLYMLTLQPEVMEQFKSMISSMLSGYGMANLPDALVEFSMNVQTDAKDMFVASSTKAHVLSGEFELTATSKELATKPLTLAMPTDYLTSDQVQSWLNTLEIFGKPAMSMPSYDPELEMIMEDEGVQDASPSWSNETSDDAVSPMQTGECAGLEPLMLVQKQKIGECPSMPKPSRR